MLANTALSKASVEREVDRWLHHIMATHVALFHFGHILSQPVLIGFCNVLVDDVMFCLVLLY